MSIRKGDDVIAGASVGFVRKPAWSQAVAISAADLYAGYTAPADGMFICAKSRPANYTVDFRTITVNNIPIVAGDFSQDGRYSYGDCSCVVNKGDLIKANANNAWDGESRIFVPFEYSGVSDVEVVTPEYIRNQNILSDWEAITLSTDSASPTVMQYDGFISGKLATQSANMGTLYINGTAFNMIATVYAIHCRFDIPVKKGDSIYFVPNGSGIDNAYARFYKLRDYTGR